MPEDPLEELKKRLYKKDESFDRRLSSPKLTPLPSKVPAFWEREEPEVMASKKFPYLKVSIVLIFLLALGSVVFYFWAGFGGVSGDNIDITVIAPTSIDGGDRMTWEVAVTNRNRQTLELADLIVEYPEGTRPIDVTVRALRERRSLGKIDQGETVRANFDAYLFGEEGNTKTLKLILEYRPQESSAILSKDETFTTRIARSPVGISFDLPKEVRAGQEIEVKVNYISNAKDELRDLNFEMEFPSDFIFKSAQPEPKEGGERNWDLGVLDPNETGIISIVGTVDGDELQEKSFRAKVSAKEPNGALSIFGGGAGSFVIKRPFLDVIVKINGEKKHIARPGERMNLEISYKNNLAVAVENSIIEVSFSGNGFDEKNIGTGRGAYRASSKTVVWTASAVPELKKLEPGEEGFLQAQFSFLEKIGIKSSSDKNFQITANVSIRPGVIPSGYVGSDLTGGDRAEAALQSELQLVRKGLYNSSSIPNRGPMPPRVDQETTFTVVWSLTNSTNDLEGLAVKSSIPVYMSWKGKINPDDGTIGFNSATGEITWQVGLLRAGTGFIRPAKEIAFQVGFTPGADLIGSTPELMSRVTASARDNFVNKEISQTANNLTLTLEDDLRLDDSDRTVVR